MGGGGGGRQIYVSNVCSQILRSVICVLVMLTFRVATIQCRMAGLEGFVPPSRYAIPPSKLTLVT
jgi:hypothetical protein